MKLLVKFAAIIGALVAATSTMGCFLILLDEPEMPENLL